MKKEITYSKKDSVFTYWKNLGIEPSNTDFVKEFSNHPLIQSLSLLSNFSFHILDHSRQNYLYMHHTVEEISGYQAKEWLQNHWTFLEKVLLKPFTHFAIHLSHKIIFEHIYQVPKQNRNQLVFAKDFGAIHPQKGEIMFLQKGMVLQQDDEGNPRYTLHAVTDITPLKKKNKANIIITHADGGVLVIYSYDTQTEILTSYGTLSTRENQVLEMLYQKLDSKTIAAKLKLSVHTVDTHRRTLLSKLNCVDTVALVTYAKMCGIIR
jgi:DNA-binding CsgD family transcriptional regulator